MRGMKREVLPTTLRDNDGNKVRRNDWGELFLSWWTGRWSPHGATNDNDDRYEHPLIVHDEAVADPLRKVASKATAPGPDGVTGMPDVRARLVAALQRRADGRENDEDRDWDFATTTFVKKTPRRDDSRTFPTDHDNEQLEQSGGDRIDKHEGRAYWTTPLSVSDPGDKREISCSRAVACRQGGHQQGLRHD